MNPCLAQTLTDGTLPPRAAVHQAAEIRVQGSYKVLQKDLDKLSQRVNTASKKTGLGPVLWRNLAISRVKDMARGLPHLSPQLWNLLLIRMLAREVSPNQTPHKPK